MERPGSDGDTLKYLRYAHMSRRASLAIRLGHDGYAQGGNLEDREPGSIPNGTYITSLRNGAYIK